MNKFKKTWLVILLVIVALCFLCVFVACGSDNASSKPNGGGNISTGTGNNPGNNVGNNNQNTSRFNDVKIEYSSAGYNVELDKDNSVDSSTAQLINTMKTLYGQLGYNMCFIGKNMDDALNAEMYMLIGANADAVDSLARGFEGTYLFKRKGSDLIVYIWPTGKPNFTPFDDAVNATHSHKFVSYVYNNDLTCVTDGTETAKCEYCNKQDTRVRQKHLGHIYRDYEYNYDATCIADGTETAKCYYCSDTITRVKIGSTAMSEHIYGDDNRCQLCHAIDPDVWTQGLEFDEITYWGGTTTAYEVTGIGSAQGDVIYIPTLYKSKKVTIISYAAFFNYSHLKRVEIPNSITDICEYSFKYCTSLTHVGIPDSVETIGRQAFFGCSRLTTIRYYGTKGQWYLIDKGSMWNSDSAIKTIECTDGTITL